MQTTKQTIFTNTETINTYDLYLTGELGRPAEYHEELEVIRNLQQQDTVILRINGPGGDCSTAVQFINAIRATQGNVVCAIEGDCLSAYTMIALACSDCSIAEHAIFMIHSYSEGSFGKYHELKAKMTHDETWWGKFAGDIYKDFLTEEEIAKLLDGKDFYLTPEEVQERLDSVAKVEQKEALENLPEDMIALSDVFAVEKELYDMVVNHYVENQCTTFPDVVIDHIHPSSEEAVDETTKPL